MPISEVDHTERWTILIRPDEGERWPDFKEHANSAIALRPDLITVVIETGTEGYLSAIRGQVIQRNGQTGRMRETVRYMPRQDPPEWAQEIISHRLHYHHLYGKIFQ
jgi:hypothetical protein